MKGCFWPTLSNKNRQDPAEIEDYFVLFSGIVIEKDDVIWNEADALPVAEDVFRWSGISTFGLNSGPVKARFTYSILARCRYFASLFTLLIYLQGGLLNVLPNQNKGKSHINKNISQNRTHV